jgi:hypothetical protein
MVDEPAGVRRLQVEDVRRDGRESLDAKLGVEKHRRNVRADEQIRQVVDDGRELVRLVLEIRLECG